MDEDKPIGRQISKKRKTLKEQLSEMEDQLKNAQEEIVSLRSHPISHGNFLALQIEFNQKDALIHQLHFYYRWHFSKNGQLHSVVEVGESRAKEVDRGVGKNQGGPESSDSSGTHSAQVPDQRRGGG
ncbi:unnamed protein product [Caenorhabditis nigoni]